MVMRMAINIEHTGSAIIQPNWCINADEIITPTLPNVSASMCKNTPVIEEQETLYIPALSH